MPTLRRVVVLGDLDKSEWPAMEVATATLGVRLQAVKLRRPEEIEGAFHLAAEERAGRLVVLPSPLTNANRMKLVALAARRRLPAVYPLRRISA